MELLETFTRPRPFTVTGEPSNQSGTDKLPNVSVVLSVKVTVAVMLLLPEPVAASRYTVLAASGLVRVSTPLPDVSRNELLAL